MPRRGSLFCCFLFVFVLYLHFSCLVNLSQTALSRGWFCINVLTNHCWIVASSFEADNKIGIFLWHVFSSFS